MNRSTTWCHETKVYLKGMVYGNSRRLLSYFLYSSSRVRGLIGNGTATITAPADIIPGSIFYRQPINHYYGVSTAEQGKFCHASGSTAASNTEALSRYTLRELCCQTPLSSRRYSIYYILHISREQSPYPCEGSLNDRYNGQSTTSPESLVAAILLLYLHISSILLTSSRSLVLRSCFKSISPNILLRCQITKPWPHPKMVKDSLHASESNTTSWGGSFRMSEDTKSTKSPTTAHENFE